MPRSSRFLLIVSICLHQKAAFSFLPSWMPGVLLNSTPELNRYTQGQTETLLDARLTIGLSTDNVFVIDGFQFQLGNQPVAKEDSIVPLPGAHGPRPHLSSGTHEIEVLKDGSFINMEGMQSVELRDAAWEMIWREGSSAGLVICGFSLGEDARRNDLLLEKGLVYLTWPVWSKDGLKEHQEIKASAEMRYRGYENERDTALEKMGGETNLLQKALYFRKAAAATEKMDITGLHNMADIPLVDDVLEIGEGLQMVRTGTVWSKNGSFSETFRARSQKLLGSVTLC